MKKSILALLLVATMLLSLLPMTVFATGTSYAITNGTPESAKEANHGYIAIDKATAEEGETVTITVKPNEGYQLKSLTVTPVAPAATTFKAVYDTNGDANTLTFYYDNKDHSGEGITVYDNLPTAATNANAWGYNSIRSSVKSVKIDSSVADYKELTSTASMFQGMTIATNISGAEYLDVSNVTDMSLMFNNFGGGTSGSPTTLNVVPDVSKWNTGNVTNMIGMFAYYGSNSELDKVPDVSGWNTGKVTDMSLMFQKYGHESKNFNVVPDVSKWNTGNVTNMTNMFFEYGYQSTALNTAPNVSGWNTGNVTKISSLFNGYGHTSNNIDCTLDLSGWDLSKITGKNGDNVFNFNPKTFNVTIPAKTGEKSNEGGKWYYGDGTNTIAPSEGKTFTLEYIEIGGVKWATKNLGAEKETDYGDYFAWGETAPYYEGTGGWPATPTWKSGKASGYVWQSYCGSSGFTEWSTPPYDATTKILKPEFDAATQILGNGWRMPTSQEFMDLYDACGGSYDKTTDPGKDTSVGKGIYLCTSYDGVAGLLFCDGTNKLFFPAAGSGYETSLTYADSRGYYWSSSLGSETFQAFYLYFRNTFFLPNTGTQRSDGYSVRPVKDAAPANKLLKSSASKQLKSSDPVDPETITPEKQQDGTYQFTMPANGVIVTAEFEAVLTAAEAAAIAAGLENNTPTTTVYSVTGYVTQTNGTISKGQQTFWLDDEKGDKKTFEGYWCNLPANEEPLRAGDKVTIVGNILRYNSTYEIKNGNVTILERAHSITNGTPESAKETNHGYIAIDKATAAENETVTITVKPNEGYQLKSLKYNDGEDHTITADKDGKYTFNMPAKDVTVTAEFEAAAPTSQYSYTEYENWQIKYGNDWTWSDNMTKVADGLFKIEILWEGTGFNVKSDENTIKKDWFAPEELTIADEVLAPVTVDVYLRVIDDETLKIGIGEDPAPTHTHAGTKQNGQPATETDAGYNDYYKCDCGLYFEDEDCTVDIGDETALESWKTGEGAIAKLVHTITPVSAQAATQTEAGFKAYYECKNCGKYYEDAEGKNEITDLSAWKAKGGNGYIPSGDEIDAAKTEAKAALDAENAKDPLTDETALTNGKSAIDSAETLADIENAKSTAITAIQEAQATELANAKTNAKNALDTEEAKDPLTDKTALTNGKISIDEAATKAEVEAAKNAAITAIQEAQATELANAKTNAKAALDTEEAKDPLTDKTALTNGKNSIDEATTKAEVEEAKDAAIKTIQKAQASELANAKADAKNALDAEEAKAPLTDKTALTNGKSSIDSAATKAAVEIAKTNAISAIQQAQKAEHDIPEPPQDGDNSNMTLWVILMVLSSMGLCACLARGKKRNIIW